MAVGVFGVVMAVLCLGLMVGCSPEGTPESETTGLDRALRLLVEDAVAQNDNVQTAALAIDAPGAGIEWRGAAGAENSADRPVRIASNTKTYVAAAV